jgi:ABC-type phosphate transport system ATPase subunit
MTVAIDPALDVAELRATGISAWFGDHKVLERVSLTMKAGEVTALIGPSGCGKSTFLRILNRMHELVPSARLSGEVKLDGHDIYAAGLTVADARKQVGMVFQRPNPFPAMSVYDNVIAGLRLTGERSTTAERDALVQESLNRAGLWTEVRGRLRQPGGALSGGQQQRLCIARSLAVRPRVLLRPGSHVHPADRGHDRGAGTRGHDRHRDPQHAAGAAGLEELRILPGIAGDPWRHRRVRTDQGHLRVAQRPAYGGLRERPLRMSGR